MEMYYDFLTFFSIFECIFILNSGSLGQVDIKSIHSYNKKVCIKM